MANETTGFEGYVEFTSVRPPRRPTLTRLGGQYIVSTYIGARCVKRDYFATREQAWERVDAIREGAAL